jgi:hypothetical protein
MSIELLAGEKQYRESSKAVQACNDYLRMGPSRSLRQLTRQYNDMPRNTTPTHSFDTLGDWSGRYGWQERAVLYDSELEARKTAEADAVMGEGLALAHERVRLLKELARNLAELVVLEGKRRGESAQVVDTPVGQLLRGVLDDIAKETGGRVNKSELDVGGEGLTIVIKPRD